MKFPPLAAAFLLAGAALPAAAPAADSGFYAGFSGIAAALDGRYDKGTFRVGADGVRGAGFRTHDDDDDSLHGLGAVLGHRWELTGDGVWLSAEVEWLSLSGALSGTNPAACDHAATCDWSLDHWADDWTLEPDSSLGLTLRLGMRADFLAPGAGMYALAGVRRVEAERRLIYSGCVTTEWSPGATCARLPNGDPGYVRHGRSAEDVDFDAWMLGAGAELPLGGGAYALQAEARYADYGRERLLSTFDGGEAPSAHSGRELGLALRVLRYF